MAERNSATGRWSRRSVLAMAAAAALRPVAGAAEFKPTRTMKIVVPFAAGGAVDVVARLVGQELSKRLGQSVVIENAPGAGGNIAFESVARAEPDGHTLVMASTNLAANPSLFEKFTLDPSKDLTPLVLIGAVPAVLLVDPKLPVSDLKALVELARARPLNYGSGGNGTSEHLAAELLKSRFGLNIVHVPYRGGALALNDLVAGHISLMITNQLNALPFVRGGQVKPIAVANPTRSEALPEVPTFAELGYPDFNVSVFWGLLGPAGLPRDVASTINAEVNAALTDPDIREKLRGMGAVIRGGGPEVLSELLKSETQLWRKVIHDANIRL